MTEDKKQNTEEHILETAKQVFEEKGLAGARMQEIADRAGINKSLLHYYYRSKEKLFHAVFSILFKKILKEFSEFFSSEDSVENKIRFFFEKHIAVLQKNPNLPVFMINEINQNPERVIEIAKKSNVAGVHKTFFAQIEEGIANGTMHRVDPLQVLVTMLSMSIFPVAAREMIRGIFGKSPEAYDQFLNERKKAAADFVIRSLFIDPENLGDTN